MPPTVDTWAGTYAEGWTVPPIHAFAITPSDSLQLPFVTRAIYVDGGTPGDVTLILAGDATPVTLKAVPPGKVLNLRVLQVMATNTTATNLVGLY
jgi:hypothetical protein